MILLNRLSLSDDVFSLATVATVVTPYSSAALFVASSKKQLATTGNKLTLSGFKNILFALSAHLKGGIETPFNFGHKRPLSNAVFYCLSKFTAVSNRLHSVMAGCIGHSLRVAVPKFGSLKPDTARHPKIETFARRLHPQNFGHTAMKTSLPGESCPQSNHTQDLTKLTQAFISLSGSFTELHTFDGLAKENQPHQYDDLIVNAEYLIKQAEKLRNEKRESNQAFIASLFNAVPVVEVSHVA